MSLPTLDSLQKLQTALHAKAKGESKFPSVPEQTFDFLGYTFGRCYRARTGEPYLGTRPRRAKIRELCESVREQTSRRFLRLDAEEQVGCLNRSLIGWANYFCLGSVSKAYRAVDAYVASRLRRWLCEKHKIRNAGITRFPDSYLVETLGLTRLWKRTRNLPWAKA